MVVLSALENPVFRTFLGHAGLVILKTCAMSIVTSFHRLTKKVFINPEDAAGFSTKTLVPNNPTVERVRRIHLNDLENVIPFVLLGLLYVASGPPQGTATLLFRIFTISRFIHTLVYLFAIPQPARALAFNIGFCIHSVSKYKMVVLSALDNPDFRTFLGHAGLVILKTFAMTIVTSYHRVNEKVFINPEDAAGFSIKTLVPNNPTVERVRRIHLNDLETVIPFVLLGLLYVASGPPQGTAILLFRIFTISRFIHTFVYLFAIPQPARALAFYIGFSVNIFMAYNILTQATF